MVPRVRFHPSAAVCRVDKAALPPRNFQAAAQEPCMRSVHAVRIKVASGWWALRVVVDAPVHQPTMRSQKHT
jgi:hypothetical protein